MLHIHICNLYMLKRELCIRMKKERKKRKVPLKFVSEKIQQQQLGFMVNSRVRASPFCCITYLFYFLFLFFPSSLSLSHKKKAVVFLVVWVTGVREEWKTLLARGQDDSLWMSTQYSRFWETVAWKNHGSLMLKVNKMSWRKNKKREGKDRLAQIRLAFSE